MSWITVTLLTVVAFFACSYGLCEWLVSRRRNDDADPTG
jgi:hypothetical protein